MCICSLRYTARNTHAPYCYLWLAQLYSIFPHYLINRATLKKLLGMKCVFRFCLQLLSETFCILRRIWRDMVNVYIGLHVNYTLFLSDFNENLIFLTK
jgi:hypothetical protein